MVYFKLTTQSKPYTLPRMGKYCDDDDADDDKVVFACSSRPSPRNKNSSKNYDDQATALI